MVAEAYYSQFRSIEYEEEKISPPTALIPLCRFNNCKPMYEAYYLTFTIMKMDNNNLW